MMSAIKMVRVCAKYMRLIFNVSTTKNVAPVLLTIDDIVGDFTHSAACLETVVMERNPRIPLHPELRAYALNLVRERVPLPQLKQHCRDWAHNKWGLAPGDTTYRYTLQDTEMTSLYRTLAREMGIPQRTAPQDNLDLWFRAKNPQPPLNDGRLTASCLSYIPYILGETDRFSIIISTPQQQILAWRYGHKQQVLMDLTFGFCSGRALLAILMVIDENNKGIPVAQLIFTAKKETKAVHADYDKKLLDEQLGLWKKGMGKNQAGDEFTPWVANTDNDTRERFALQRNWENILLLLCMFHIWQCWRNGLNKHLRVIPTEGEHRQKIRSRLGRFLMRLLKDITTHEEALAAYNTELGYFTGLSKSKDTIQKKQGQGGLSFLTYLQSYLKVRDFWRSWSVAGAMEAAKRMDVPLSRIARTTNHLESFNGRLKGKYFAPYLRSGRLPRIDLWIHILITEALPTFFAEWAERRDLKDYLSFMRHAPDPQRPLITHEEQPRSKKDKKGSHEERSVKSFKTPAQVIAAAKRWEEEIFSPALLKRVAKRNDVDREHEEALQALEISMIAELDDDGDSDDENSQAGVTREADGFGVEAEIARGESVEDEIPHQEHGSANSEHAVAQDPDVGMEASHADSLYAEPPSQDYNAIYSPESSTSTLAGDTALDESDILGDLSSVDIPFPFELAQPPSPQEDDDFFPSEPSRHSNRQGTAMLDVLKAEDSLRNALREALDAGVPPKSLDCHISLSLREQLFGEIPRPIEVPASMTRRRSSVAAGVALPDVESHDRRPRVLPDFEPQKKSKRHVSYALR
jgi:hypothetical protein